MSDGESENVRVAVRVRPFISFELHPEFVFLQERNCTCVTAQPSSSSCDFVDPRIKLLYRHRLKYVMISLMNRLGSTKDICVETYYTSIPLQHDSLHSRDLQDGKLYQNF